MTTENHERFMTPQKNSVLRRWLTERVLMAIRAAARLLRRAANTFDTIANTQMWVMKHPRRNMVDDIDERHYGIQYLQWLEPLIAALPQGGRVIDLGCGYGRLALEVAARRPDCNVEGFDIAASAVEGATAYAAKRGLTNCRFLERDLAEYLQEVESESTDLILFVEVSFFAPHNLNILSQSARILRPNGHLFGAFRSQWFNLVHAIVAHDVESARLVRDSREGRLWGSGHRFWWHTIADIEREFAEAGFTVAGPYRGIGVLSGLKGDSGLPQPSSFDTRARAVLLDLELSFADSYPQQGRYIVAVGKK